MDKEQRKPLKIFDINRVQYSANAGNAQKTMEFGGNYSGAMADRGANGTVFGKGMSVVAWTVRTIDLTGLQDHTVRELRIGTAACVCRSHLGDCIQIYNQGAGMPDGKTILAPLQMEANGCIVNEKAMKITGEQPYIQSPDGYRFPLYVKEGLSYMKIRPVRDEEWDKLPQTIMTKDVEWDPRVYDNGVDNEWWNKNKDSVEKHYEGLPYNEHGLFEVETESGATEAETDDDSDLPENGITVSEVRVHLTQLVQDELMDSVVEYQVDGETYHQYLSESDSNSEWGDVDSPQPSWSCFDVRGRRISSRARTKVDYSDTPRRSKHKPPTLQPPIEQSNVAPKDPRETVTDTHTDIVDEEDQAVREDYNNKARSTSQNAERTVGPYLGKPSKVHYPDYARYFAGAPEKVIEKTFKNTTQLGRLGVIDGLKLWRRFKSPNPALNIMRRNEAVATDTVYGPVPAIDDGSTAAQFFIGRKSGFTAIEPLGKSDKMFPRALLNHIRRYGAMDMLISDNAKAQISDRVTEILGTLGINNHNSEAYNKNQNFSERGYQDIKRAATHLLNFSNAPDFVWLLALQYACFIHNHLASERLGWRTPFEWLTGVTPELTVLLAFIFFEPVFYRVFDNPDDEEEKMGRFVGIAEHVGHAMTFKILTNDLKVVSRSLVRPASKDGIFKNQRAIDKADVISPKQPNNNNSKN